MGTLWSRSGSIERDLNDERAVGAKAYFYQGGTTTPLQVYLDAGQASPQSVPVLADGNGRWPSVFIPFIVSYDVRVTDANDSQLYYFLGIANPDPIATTVVIPAEEKVQTGMIHFELLNTTKSGYVRLNNRTIGNAASSATERANADTAALFAYLWNNLTDAIAPVSGGRGGSAAADYAANKTIGLPDMRGTSPIGVDDMGNSAASRFPAEVGAFGAGNATTGGSSVGANTHQLTVAQLATVTPAGSISTPAGSVQFSAIDVFNQLGLFVLGTGNGSVGSGNSLLRASAPGSSLPISQSLSGSVNATFTGNAQTFTGTPFGSNTAHNNLHLSRLGTWFIKL